MDQRHCSTPRNEKDLLEKLTKLIFNSERGIAMEASIQMQRLIENTNMLSIRPIQLCYILGGDPKLLIATPIKNQSFQGRPMTVRSNFRDLINMMETIGKEEMKGEKIKIYSRHQPNKIFAVALDGGGIRGLISATILRFVSRRLFGSEKDIKKKFQWFIGTSTGGILALGLTKKEWALTPTECIQFYWKLKSEVFVKSHFLPDWFVSATSWHAPKQSENLKKALSKIFYPDERFDKFSMNGHFVPRIAITSLEISNIHAQELALFRNYSIGNFDNIAASNETLIEIALRTSAAPTFFKSQRSDDGRRFVDGGLSANCPLLQLINEIYLLELDRGKVGGILSIGTGSKTCSPRPDGEPGLMAQKQLLVESSTSRNTAVNHARLWCKRTGDIQFLRLCPPGIDSQLNETCPIKLLAMIWETFYYLCDQQRTTEIDSFATVYQNCCLRNEALVFNNAEIWNRL